MCTADMRPPTSLRCCAPAAKAYLQQLRQAERAEGSGSEDETTHDAVAQRLRADALEVPIWFPQHCNTAAMPNMHKFGGLRCRSACVLTRIVARHVSVMGCRRWGSCRGA